MSFHPLITIQGFVTEDKARTKYVSMIYFCLKMLNRK